ncbi:MAG TPA: FHA domain-containing protein [Kofleriaceae bacterium]|nr:FHA domain-containing protein [Kofleriaceae bacterium]
MTGGTCVICGQRPAANGVLCENCTGLLEASVAIAPQQIQLRTGHTGDAALIDVWGEPHQLDAPRTPVGRADISHGLVIVEPSVSRAHAQLEKRDRWYVKDVGSSSGTFVNDKPVREAPLGTGDRVRFGDIEFFFVVTAMPFPPRPERIDIPTVRAPAKGTQPLPMRVHTTPIELQSPRGGGGGVVVIAGKPVQLTQPQYELMALLVERMRDDAGKPQDLRGYVAMPELMRLSLDVPDPGEDHVRQLVRRVRRALLKADIGDLIEAKRGIGYRLRVVPRD